MLSFNHKGRDFKMKKSRAGLEKEIANIISTNLMEKKVLDAWTKSIEDNYEVPEKYSTDFLTKRRSITEADDFMLFILADILLGKHSIDEYYTPKEIKGLSQSKWHIEKVNFPLRYKMTKITEQQYIGCISVKELMLLKDAQLINYNENAQRTMRHIVKGETEFFQIALNKEAVRAIMESYESDLYIPNTITLNLPEDAMFDYNEKTGELVINELEYFDILDGYHRYIAMSKIAAQNPNFDYQMELRIVQFEESKAKRFIWQEDQKTKMRKIDSDAMDTSKVSNRIVERMNNDNQFLLAGQISRNKGIINASYLSNIIDIVYLKGVKKSEERLMIKKVSESLMSAIEWYTDKNPEYLNKPWDKKLIYMVAYEDRYGELNDIAKDYLKVKAESDIYANPNLIQLDITRTHKLLRKEDM